MVQDSQFNSNDSAAIKLTTSELTHKDEAPGALQALWQAAYDHPVETGLAVSAVVAVGGAIAYSASKGRISGLLNGKPEVLLIEDTPAMANAFREALQANGNKVTWVTGIKSLSPLTGFTEDGGEMALSKRFRVALVDGDLGKGRLTGPEIVGALNDRKIVSIGTSAVDTFNTAMVENGAPRAIAANKGVVYASILGNRLDFREAIKSPGTVQASLNAFKTAIRLPENEALKKAADANLMKFLLAK